MYDDAMLGELCQPAGAMRCRESQLIAFGGDREVDCRVPIRQTLTKLWFVTGDVNGVGRR